MSDKKQIYKYFSKDVQSHLEELYEFDNKINELLLNKILVFENENKDLKQKNKNIEISVEALKKSMKNAQKDYKILKEEEDLLVKLQSTKKLIQQNEAELPETPPRKRRKTTEENIDNHNKTSKNCLVNEGLLIIRFLFVK